MSDEQLDRLRVDGTFVRVRRDDDPSFSVRGIVVAWDEQSVLIRKQNRKVLKVPRDSQFAVES
jgi:hypothetical protein